MKTRLTYILILSGILLFSSCRKSNGGKNNLPSLQETYKNNDTRPFGTSVFYRLIKDIYPGTESTKKKESFDRTWKDIYDTAALYISVSKSLYTSDADVDAIMDYVKDGNDAVFIAAAFDENLMDKLGCRVDYTPGLLGLLPDSMTDTYVMLDSNAVNGGGEYAYYYLPFTGRFTKMPEKNYRVLGYNQYNQPDNIVCFIGKGRLFLHCEPRAFSNYFLLQKDNYKYLQKYISLTNKPGRRNPQHVYWNDYYVSINHPRSSRSESSNSGSSLSEIMGNRELAFAFWLILVLLLLYIIYGMKRTQRIIEKVKPNENTSVTFTETVGRLYLQKKDNRNIAEKMITYFNEFIRNQYFLNTNHVNEEFVSTLSRKSGVDLEMVTALYSTIDQTMRKSQVTDVDLLRLNNNIQTFYKNKI